MKRLSDIAMLEFESPDWYLVPPHMREGLDRWISHGVPPGGFLQAVLRGELFEALARADFINQQGIWGICQFLEQAAPQECYGSPEAYQRWFNKHLRARELRQRERS